MAPRLMHLRLRPTALAVAALLATSLGTSGVVAGASSADAAASPPPVPAPTLVHLLPGHPRDHAALQAAAAAAARQKASAARARRIETAGQSPTLAATSSYGDFTATPLAPSSSWTAGTQSGAFDWSYPMRVPAAPAGPQPQVGLAYDSGNTDGRTPATNNQGSQLGEGFELTASSFISRSYTPCPEDGDDSKDDLCWNSGEVSLVLNGQGSPLVQLADGSYRLAQDDDSKLEHLTGTANGDNNGEYWRLTTADGTQYYFGLNTIGSRQTDSTWTVPVYGNDAGEPCNGQPGGWCQQAWQWNLDKVVDTNGNAATYWYNDEQNYYLRGGSSLTAYDRGGYLTEIDYGLQDSDLDATPPYKVTFSATIRCTAGADKCGSSPNGHGSEWPDVPVNSICHAGDSCTGNTAPTFFTTKMLAAVTTYVMLPPPDDVYQKADSWSLTEEFLQPYDDGANRAQVLWLGSVQHTGSDDNNGDPIQLPPTQFTATFKDNRVDDVGDGIPPLARPRLTEIQTESGEYIDITYALQDCSPGDLPNPANNHRRCFPAYWTPSGYADPTLDWFHKYPVTAVTVSDPNNPITSPDVTTSYVYVNPSWHYDASPNQRTQYTTWSQWRGFSQVITTVGGNSSPHRSSTVDVYMQGMNGDLDGSDGKKSVQVTGVDAAPLDDDDQLAGYLREHVAYNGYVSGPDQEDDVPQVSDVVNDPWSSQTGKQTFDAHGDYQSVTLHAWMVRTDTTTDTTFLTAPAGTRTRVVKTTFNTDGLPLTITDRGDTSVSGDESCTTTWYARNDAAWITALPSRVQVLAGTCNAKQSVDLPRHDDADGDVISDTATLYDNATDWSTEKATQGNVTSTQRVTGYTADGQPAGWQTTSTIQYDALGRVKSVADAEGHTTRTSYNPAGMGVPISSTTTQPMGLVSTTTFDPVWGSPVDAEDVNGNHTRYSYDALGRATGYWLPSNPYGAAYKTFGYHVSASGNNWVSTATLHGQTGVYNTSYEFFDAMLRPIQTQTISADLDDQDSVGRLISETTYTPLGLVDVQMADAYDNHLPSSQMATIAYGGAPKQVDIDYDGAQRPISHTYSFPNDLTWTTTTTYDGRSVATSAPAGGSATQSFSDALGRTTELRVYGNEQPTGDYRSTTYQYSPTGRLDSVEGPDGASSTYNYDLYGRQTSSTTPESGTTTTTYTDLDQVATTTDARDQTLLFDYDNLGRKTDEWANDETNANKLAAWTYDTAVNGVGMLGSATSYVGGTGGDAYTKTVDDYNQLGEPTQSHLTIPTDDSLVTSGAMGTTLTVTTDYDPLDGTVAAIKNPAVAGLPYEPTAIHYNQSGLPITARNIAATSYTPTGQLLQRTYSYDPDLPDTAYLTNTYQDGTDRLVRSTVLDMVHDAGSGAFVDSDHTYRYNDAGNLLEDDDAADLGISGNYQNQCYRYSGWQQLTQAWTRKGADTCQDLPNGYADLGGAAKYWSTYTYTTAGQRATSKTRSAAGPTSTTYAYDAACGGAGTDYVHTLASTSVTDPDGNTSVNNYTCDDSGDTTQRPGPQNSQTLTWDTSQRLVKMHQDSAGGDPAVTTNNIYDADGNLLIRRTISGNDTNSTLYYGWNEIHLDSVDQGGSATNTVSGLRYTSLGDQTVMLEIGHPGGQVDEYWPFPDDHGTVSLTLQHTPQMPITKRYLSPFGQPVGSQPAWPDDKRFLGKPFDADNGLSTLGARYYDGKLGAFISPDPIIDTADPLSLNGYAYAEDNPLSNSDPGGTYFRADSQMTQPGDPRTYVGRFRFDQSHLPDPQMWGQLIVKAPKVSPWAFFGGAIYNGFLGASSLLLEGGGDIGILAAAATPAGMQSLVMNGELPNALSAVHSGVATGMSAIGGNPNSGAYKFGQAMAEGGSLVIPGGAALEAGSVLDAGVGLARFGEAEAGIEQSAASFVPEAGKPVPDPEPQFLPDGTPDRGPAAWVNTIDEEGNVTTHASSPGMHAEVNAQAAEPGAPMSRVWGWRGPTSAPVWQEIPICASCQARFPRSMFPPGTQSDRGPWGSE